LGELIISVAGNCGLKGRKRSFFRQAVWRITFVGWRWPGKVASLEGFDTLTHAHAPRRLLPTFLNLAGQAIAENYNLMVVEL